MSRKPVLRKTRLAEADYPDILRYTLRRWGKEQFAAYRRLLNDGISAVASDPDRPSSRARDELQAGVRSFNIGSLATRVGDGRHVLYYRVGADGIVEILRILHDRMEIEDRLPE